MNSTVGETKETRLYAMIIIKLRYKNNNSNIILLLRVRNYANYKDFYYFIERQKRNFHVYY